MTRSFPEAATALHGVAQSLHGLRRRLLEASRGRFRRVPEDAVAIVLHAEQDILGVADGLSELQRPERPIASAITELSGVKP